MPEQYRKVVSRDGSYVDYTVKDVGVRVHKTLCRPIIIERGRWTEYGVPYTIPVELSVLRAQKTGISSLASNLSQIEEAIPEVSVRSELRGLITGRINFDDALRTET